MHKTLLCVLVSMFLALGAAAQAPVLKIGRPFVETSVQSVICEGNRRSYRSFNHCWRVNGRRNTRSANYCSRICSNAPSK
jgi:hypothetical protein